MANSSHKRGGSKTALDRPAKPFPKFPLYAHPMGYWAKKINGQIKYFGRWGRKVDGVMVREPNDGWAEALTLFNAQYADLKAGRKPRPADAPTELTVMELANKFLNAKLRKLNAGELSHRSLADYKATADRLLAEFGKKRLVSDLRPDDFAELRAELAKRVGPVRLGKEITHIRSVMKYAFDNRLIDQPVEFGSEFRVPDKATLRRHKAGKAKKLFTADEISRLLDAADPVMKAATLLGINCGAGNTDVANLQLHHLDLDSGWLDYPRGKTGIGRRIPLWPETVAALREAIATRTKPKDPKADGQCVLLSVRGERLVRMTETSRTDGVTTGFGKLLRKLKINGREGLGFYSLRHTFATIGLQTGDRDAVKALMGHVETDMLSHYDETGPSDDRRLAVTNHVRHWLFPKSTANRASSKKGGVK